MVSGARGRFTCGEENLLIHHKSQNIMNMIVDIEMYNRLNV